jgi:hypothetical protein
MSSDDSSYTLPDGTTWSDGSTTVTTVDAPAGATPTTTTYQFNAPLTSGFAVPSASTNLANWQSAGGQVMQGSAIPSGGLQQISLEGASQTVQSFKPAAAAAGQPQGGSGMVSVTGPFPDTAAAFAAKGHSK